MMTMLMRMKKRKVSNSDDVIVSIISHIERVSNGWRSATAAAALVVHSNADRQQRFYSLLHTAKQYQSVSKGYDAFYKTVASSRT